MSTGEFSPLRHHGTKDFNSFFVPSCFGGELVSFCGQAGTRRRAWSSEPCAQKNRGPVSGGSWTFALAPITVVTPSLRSHPPGAEAVKKVPKLKILETVT